MPSDLIIDAGANRGEFSLLLAERNAALRVLAIEPEPRLATDLEMQATVRGLENHTTIRSAIALLEGEARFFVSEEGDWGTSSLLPFDGKHLKDDEYWATRADLRHTAEIVVSTQRLGSILDTFDYDRIAFLKIDTQGLDVDVLASLGAHLPRLDAGMLEVVGAPCRSLYVDEQSTMLKALTFLAKNGFEPYAVKPNDPAANEFNIYFTRTGLDFREVEDRLSLNGVHMYDGKHYWLVPSPILSDPMAELNAVRARTAELTGALDQAHARATESIGTLTQERDVAQADLTARTQEYAVRIEALGHSIETAAEQVVAAQRRHDVAQERHDAVQERHDAVQARLDAAQVEHDILRRQARIRDRLVGRMQRALRTSKALATDTAKLLAQAQEREAALACDLANLHVELEALGKVAGQLPGLQDAIRGETAEKHELSTRLESVRHALDRALDEHRDLAAQRDESRHAFERSAGERDDLMTQLEEVRRALDLANGESRDLGLQLSAIRNHWTYRLTRLAFPGHAFRLAGQASAGIPRGAATMFQPRIDGIPVIYYDVTDLVRHAQHSDKVTGIQRVVLEGLRGIGGQAQPIFLSPATGKWYVLEDLDVGEMQDLSRFRGLWERADLVEFPTRGTVTHYLKHRPKERGLRRRLHDRLVRVPAARRKLNRYTARFLAPQVFPGHWPKIRLLPALQPSDKLVLFGTPWNALQAYETLFVAAPREVEKILLVYDLIPLNSPYVPDSLRDDFRIFIPFVLRHASRIIVNSDSVGSDLDEYARRHGFALPKLHKINLAHHFPPETSPRGDISLRVRKLFAEKYVLCVGSIESRKNHLNLLTMWSKFVRSADYYGEKLVLAGNWLWDFHAIQNLLHETGHVYGSVIVIEGPSDVELRELYAHCRFTSYPSHYEGFGLPVGESLSHGKPCLHFDNSSLVEAGYGLSDFVPYHDLRWYYQAFRRLMVDDLYYAERCKRIAEGRDRLRYWADFSREVGAVLRT